MNIAYLPVGSIRNKKEAIRITLVSMAKRLSKQGYNIHIFPEVHKLAPKYEKDEIEIHRLYGVKFTTPKLLRILFNAFGEILSLNKIQKERKIKFEILHGFSAAPMNAIKLIIARKLFCKNAKIIQSIKTKSFFKIGGLFTKILNYCDIVTVPTNIMKQELIEKGIKEEKIKILRSYINLEKFKPMNKEELKKKYNFENKKIIFYYGLLHERKGTPTLIKAMDEVLKKRDDTIFIFAPRSEIKEFDDQLNSYDKNKVIIIKENINLPEYINLADCVVLPYHSLVSTEGNPSCLLESVACNTPVITSNLPEIKEIFHEGLIFTKPKDYQEVKNKIIETLENPEKAKILITKASKEIQKFNIIEIEKEFLKLYEK